MWPSKFLKHRIQFIAAVVCLAFTSSAAADWCGVHEPAENHPLAWKHFSTPVESRLEAREYESAYRLIVDSYDAHFGAKDPALLADLRSKFTRYLEMRKQQGDRPSDWDYVPPVGENNVKLILDNGAGGGSINVHAVGCDSEAWDDIESADVAVFYLAAAMNRATSDGIDTLRRLAAEEADAQRQSYHDWVFNGLAMWPWELKANEYFLDDDGPAPDSQLTLLRPSPALALRTEDVTNAELNYALMLEPLGYVKYLDDSGYRDWWGISPIVTVTDDNGAGYGLLARYNQFTLGAAHHESVDEVLLFFSIDLYQSLMSHEDKLRQVKALFEKD